VRVLHTGDWHLGRQIRGLSRQAEFESVLEEIVSIATAEAVDVFVVAGDIFDTFSPPTDAERLLYETLTRLLSEGVQVVLVAGNHDHAGRMDALAGILKLAGIHCVGSVPAAAGEPIHLRSRDGETALTVIALPWVPERKTFDVESLGGPIEGPIQQYAAKLEQALRHFWQPAAREPLNLFVGHMLVDGAVVSENGGERRLHIGQSFAVPAQALPPAQYVALGHVHRHQRLGAASPAYYSGSILQLDFGEAGQEKYVNLVDLQPSLPATVSKIALQSGRRLRSESLRLDELDAAAARFGDDYLRVTVELEGPLSSLYQQVRERLPNAVEVTPRYPEQQELLVAAEQQSGLSPEELFGRYYRQRYGIEVTAELVKAFSELHAEALANAAP